MPNLCRSGLIQAETFAEMSMNTSYPIKKAAIAAHLRDLFPHLFSFPVPLKVGIHRDLMSLPGRQFGASALRSFLCKWTSSPDYCHAVAVAKSRYALDGSMAPLVKN